MHYVVKEVRFRSIIRSIRSIIIKMIIHFRNTLITNFLKMICTETRLFRIIIQISLYLHIRWVSISDVR